MVPPDDHGNMPKYNVPGVSIEEFSSQPPSIALAPTSVTVLWERRRWYLPTEAVSISDIRNLRSGLDSKNAAIYYPWVTIPDASVPVQPQ